METGFRMQGKSAKPTPPSCSTCVKFDAYGQASSYAKIVTTDANGNYKFNNLSAGSYSVAFSLLPDSKASPANVGTQ